MHIAARSGQEHMIKALLEDGANPTAFSKVVQCIPISICSFIVWTDANLYQNHKTSANTAQTIYQISCFESF